MTYHNATKYILNAPDSAPDTTPGARLKQVWELLGNPQRHLKYLRLAGSNGKTVCAEMLMSAFQNSAYTVGCFTTPMQAEIRNNIRINAVSLSFEEAATCVELIHRAITDFNKETAKKAETEESDGGETVLHPQLILTKAEILLTAALLAFHRAKCKFCLIESDRDFADTMRFLPPPFAAAICGTIPSNDRKEIQQIRSYICHGIQEIVSAPQDQDAYRVISDTCAAVNCRLTIPTKSEIEIHRLTLIGSDFSYRQKDYHLSLCGKFQISNATVVLEILEMLARRGYRLSEEQIRKGLHQTKIPCKFEILATTPTIIADSTHSEVAIGAVCDSMADFRSMIGSKVRLCLPEGAIVDRYVEVLTSRQYEVLKIITAPKELSPNSSNSPYDPHKKKIREVVAQALDGLQKDEILLISGSSAFTADIRYELLKKLAF